jgi:hypothetical protein
MKDGAFHVSNGSTVEALWALGALEPPKKVKAARRAGWGVVERVPKTAPQRRRFLPPFHRHRDLCGKI